MQWLIKTFEKLEGKYGPLVLVIFIVGFFGWMQYEERQENQAFYRQQQEKWYHTSEQQSEKMINKFANVVDKNSDAWEETADALNANSIVLTKLETTVKMLRP